MNIIRYAFKDIKSQKFRAILGIVGVSISIFLLTTVSFLTDTVSATYVDFLTTDAGNVDIDIYTRRVSQDQEQLPTNFDYMEMINNISNSPAGDDLDAYIPRFINTSYSSNRTGSNSVYGFYFIALNVSYERDIGFGNINADYDFEQNGIPRGSCAISSSLASDLGLQKGDIMNISRSRYYTNWTGKPDYWMNLTVCAVFTHSLKFPSHMEDVVLVDIADLAHDIGFPGEPNEYYEGKCNHIYITLKNAQEHYDIRDVEGSTEKILDIAADIQLTIGYGYWIELPKLQWLEYAEYIGMMTSIIFVFIGLIAMLIAGILINGILSTSVEERIREFGIFRCLGAHKIFNLKLVITQAIMICLFGTTLGVGSSALFMSKIVVPILNDLAPEQYLANEIVFVAQPTSYILSYIIGIGVSMAVSISPALKVMRMPIVQAINPYRHEENLYKLVRDQKINYKLILFGGLLAGNGGFIFFIIPQLALSMQVGAIATSFLVILLVFLIGLTMAGIGLMPLLLRFWILVIRPFGRKLMNIIKVTIFRYQRRNYSTILMFCLSFSFVIFTSSMINILLTQVSAMVEFDAGSPLVLYRTWGADLDAPTVELQEDLMQVEGIERTSAVIANPWQLSEIYSEDGKVFDSEIGDYIYLKSEDATIYGIDENYMDTIYDEYVSFTSGNQDDAFEDLFNGSNNCIISTALSQNLALDLGDEVRMTFYRGDESEVEIFKIVGIAEKMSGFYRFKQTGSFGDADGVLISDDKYIEYMAIPNPAWVYKIYIDLREDYMNVEGSEEVRDEIYSTLSSDWTFWVDNVLSDVEEMTSTFIMVELGLQLVLSFTIVICMFGLFASSYSSIIERKREIGILRALGLKRKGVGKFFTIESLIILLSSGSTGAIVGYATAALLTENMTLFTESPRLLSIPYQALIILFGTAIIVMLVGMRVLLRKIKKQNLIEIFRETT
ncbi:MAG: FtsX-like permease family protein [Candidatus Lokiarchaeota archaeon]|nr:FtsX-like permease family protein [Candidatus Lokiarchaeota archaeon]